MKKRGNANWIPTGREDNLPLLGDECKWYRVILDEAQWIKNKSTKQAQAVSQLQALTRFCMTGTPMSKLLQIVSADATFRVTDWRIVSEQCVGTLQSDSFPSHPPSESVFSH